ncbi:MAG: transglutaminase-like domain-containing protein [Candidatus Omnitrophota bacterium]|nr:transglutaminase-like domain-containing protein [Candidatus Omnitrophota bacterium]
METINPKIRIKPSAAMRRMKGIILFVCFISYLFTADYAYSADNKYKFRIRHVKTQKDGVLVSRPSKIDEKIYKLLKNNKIYTPKDYAKWLEKHIVYRKDSKAGAWADPLSVLARKFGDCEDFAFLNVAVLRVMGYSPKFFTFHSEEKGHAICVFQDKGHYYYFDNMKLKKIQEPTIFEFAKGLLSQETYTEIRELDFNTRKWNLVYKNS